MTNSCALPRGWLLESAYFSCNFMINKDFYKIRGLCHNPVNFPAGRGLSAFSQFFST